MFLTELPQYLISCLLALFSKCKRLGIESIKFFIPSTELFSNKFFTWEVNPLGDSDLICFGNKCF